MGEGHLFVYGQLKRGFPLYEQLGLETHLDFVGEGLLGGATLFNHNGDYPYAVLGTADIVKGEVFSLRSLVTLDMLDMEERPFGYRREVCTVHVSGIPYVCEAYVMPKSRDGDRVISDSVWTRR